MAMPKNFMDKMMPGGPAVSQPPAGNPAAPPPFPPKPMHKKHHKKHEEKGVGRGAKPRGGMA